MTTLPERLQDVIAEMDLRFKSGNSVPVRTVQLTAERWAEIRAALVAAQALQAAPEGGELFGYVAAFSADAMKKCAKDEHNGCVEVRMRRRANSDVPVYLAAPSPSAALQAGEA